MSRFAISQRLTVKATRPCSNDYPVPRQPLQQTERILGKIDGKEHLNIIEQDHGRDMSANYVGENAGHPNGTLFLRELQELLR